jgi:AcrR family transcriptional regulator
MQRKVISINELGQAREKLLDAVGRVLSEKGPAFVDGRSVAEKAGVEKGLIQRVFGSFSGLMKAYGKSEEYWPDVEELAGGNMEEMQQMPVEEAAALFFRSLLTALLKRPRTLDIMVLEVGQESPWSRALEYKRERTALEFFESMGQDPPPEVDFSALVAVMAASVAYLCTRSRLHNTYGGLDLGDDKDVGRVLSMMEALIKGVISKDEKDGS